jgi:uncharacterized membrane protein YedE/YeeE
LSHPLALPALGGALIGLAATLLLWGTRQTAGISSIVAGLGQRAGADRRWRAEFVVGLLVGGAMLAVLAPAVIGTAPRSTVWLLLAGLLAGFGARLGGGCTSGHGVCGVSRLSGRSLVATLTFVATGMLTVWLSARFGVAP